MTRLAFAAFALLAACKPDPTPVWAVDPIWVEPAERGILGFQTWELYDARWERKHSDRSFVCAVVVQIEGTQTPCTDCQLAWAVTPTLVQSDCAADVEANPIWLQLERLSLGPPVEGPDATYPGVTSVGFADYGYGWEVHGQAWPDAVGHGQAAADGTWDDAQAFTFEPELAWPL